MESVPDWSGLAGDLLEQIAIRLVKKEDFTAFRGVCTSWRAAVTEDRYLNGGKIMLLLPEKNGECELYSLPERKICAKIALPEVIGRKTCFDVGFGWILTVSYSDGDVALLKPLSKAKPIRLRTFKTQLQCTKVKEAMLSDDPSSSNAVLTMRTDDTDFLSVWIRNGNWEASLEHSISSLSDESSYYYYGKEIYALEIYSGRISTSKMITRWTSGSARTRFTLVVSVDKTVLSATSNYLVKSTAGDLLLISRHDKSRSFSVIRIDVARKQWEVTNDLRGDAILLSDNLRVSVAAADFPGVLKPNCIYFTNYFEKKPNSRSVLKPKWLYFTNDFAEDKPISWPKDMGVYNIEDLSLETFNFETSYGLSSPPIWILKH